MELISLRLDSDVLREADRLAATSKPPATRAAMLREVIRRGLLDVNAERRTEQRTHERKAS